MRKRLFIFSALLFFLIGTHNTFAQVPLPSCGADVSYHVTGDPLDTCLVAGNSITFNSNTPMFFFLDDLNTGINVWNSYPFAQTSVDWNTSISGTYILLHMFL